MASNGDPTYPESRPAGNPLSNSLENNITASDSDPTYPERRPTGNPYPKRGQIKLKIAEDFVSSVTSMAGGGRWREEPEEREDRDGSSAAGLSQSEDNPISEL